MAVPPFVHSTGLIAPQAVAPPDDEHTPDPTFSWHAVLEVVQALALAVVISVVLNMWVVQVTEVLQRSMEPTLMQNDRVLVSKVDYRFGSPQRGDIIVFNPPTPSAIPFVKRVIGLGGDVIELRGGSVFVNGVLEQTPQAHGQTLPQAATVAYPFTVPTGEVFVMGDNRSFSSDSRTFGSVPIPNIIGKVILRFWPLDRLVFFAW
jgi:signal peptidase I